MTNIVSSFSQLVLWHYWTSRCDLQLSDFSVILSWLYGFLDFFFTRTTTALPEVLVHELNAVLDVVSHDHVGKEQLRNTACIESRNGLSILT